MVTLPFLALSFCKLYFLIWIFVYIFHLAILLGHTKMAVGDIKQALLQLDERVLTPELLKQLLAYAPDSEEVRLQNKYLCFYIRGFILIVKDQCLMLPVSENAVSNCLLISFRWRNMMNIVVCWMT